MEQQKPKQNQEDSKMRSNRIHFYNDISGQNTFQKRAFERATTSKVFEIGENVIAKQDESGGIPLAAREYVILNHLKETGVVPKVDEETGLYGYPLTFEMEKINNGASLEDWLATYTVKPELIEIMPEILQNLRMGIAKMWAKGVVHGDLHLNNIVIGMKKGGLMIEPKIIDFGVSMMKEGKMKSLAADLGVLDELGESNYYFNRQVSKRYDDKDQELDFIVEEIDDFVRCKDIGKLLKDFRDELGKHT